MVSVTYRPSKNQLHSVSFQKLWSAETRISDETWRLDRSEVLSIPPQLGLLPGSPERYPDTVEVWRSSRHGPNTVPRNFADLSHPERPTRGARRLSGRTSSSVCWRPRVAARNALDLSRPRTLTAPTTGSSSMSVTWRKRRPESAHSPAGQLPICNLNAAGRPTLWHDPEDRDARKRAEGPRGGATSTVALTAGFTYNQF